MVLTGSRLRLRPWCRSDLDPFAAMSADPAVMRHLLPLPDRAACAAVIERFERHRDEHGFTFWAIEVPGLCPFIGFAGLLRVGFEAPFTPAVEIGWRLASAHWGQGYATEAANLALRHGFEDHGLRQIVALTVPDNSRSRRVMQRLGMRHDPRDDFDHPRVPDGHPLKRHVLYRLDRADYSTTA